MGSLSNSIEAFYTAFQDVPKPRRINGCPCCIDDEEISVLLSKPLREISSDELESYSFSAFLTVGAEADYMYFLPRILEIACTENSSWPDIEIIGRAIGEVKPANWPKEQKLALIDVLSSVIQEVAEEMNGFSIDSWICAIAKMGLDVRIFLKQIEQSPEAILAFYESNARTLLNKQKLSNSFWGKDTPCYNEVIQWFQRPDISQIFYDHYGLTPNSGK